MVGVGVTRRVHTIFKLPRIDFNGHFGFLIIRKKGGKEEKLEAN